MPTAVGAGILHTSLSRLSACYGLFTDGANGGRWQLKVRDDAGFDVGRLAAWRLSARIA